MKLSNEMSAIVTGGASGLGRATARLLADQGVKVALFDVNDEAGEEAASEIGGVYCKCDVTDENSIQDALTKARAVNGQERILINCAGIVYGSKTIRKDRDSGAILPHDLKGYKKTIEVNLIGAFNMIALCAAGMAGLEPVTDDGGRGVIISTSSVAAEDGQMGQAAYASSKGGIASLSLPVARDLAREGIRVCAIMPGLFHTPMFDVLPDEAKQSLAASVPFPSRLGSPAEFAALVQHICENDMLNGTNIRLDGAIRLAPK